MSSSLPVAFQQMYAPQTVHPPLPGPDLGLQREAAAEEPGTCRWKWLSRAPAVPDTGAHVAPYPKLQRGKRQTSGRLKDSYKCDTGTNKSQLAGR